jgi:hypothetical protein
MHWFTKSWWKYLLEKPHHSSNRIKSFICRMRGHPCSVWWYNWGLAPDMHCKNCGDDLG